MRFDSIIFKSGMKISYQFKIQIFNKSYLFSKLFEFLSKSEQISTTQFKINDAYIWLAITSESCAERRLCSGLNGAKSGLVGAPDAGIEGWIGTSGAGFVGLVECLL